MSDQSNENPTNTTGEPQVVPVASQHEVVPPGGQAEGQQVAEPGDQAAPAPGDGGEANIAATDGAEVNVEVQAASPAEGGEQ